ncbi:AI-2E family transporter, partial [Gardnerella vaginalis]
LSVLIMGAVFGALGAFLALPVTASLQAILKVCTKQYNLVSSPLMDDPKPNRKSIMVTSVEAIRNSFVKPVKDSVLRVMKGSSSRVSINEDIMYWYKQAYNSSDETIENENSVDDSGYVETMAISRDILDAVNKDIAKKRAENSDSDKSQATDRDKEELKSKTNKSGTIPNENKKENKKATNSNSNPRSGWNK